MNASKAHDSESTTSDPKRELVRHTLATLAYRGGKALRNAPPEFAEFNPGHELRTPLQTLAHLGDLFEWALSIAMGRRTWQDSRPLPWEQEVERFFATLKQFDDLLASNQPIHASTEKLFQGPVADALTHVGQINIFRRMAGSPVKGESYYEAEIEMGRVGPDQALPRREF
jgi:hypothetical protein